MADSQDRRTRMIHSSVGAQPAKGGAGGQFTWGSAPDNYEFVETSIAPKVITAQVVNSQPIMQPAIAQNFQLNGMEFPSLVQGTSPAPMMLPIGTAAPVRWGPPVSKPVVLAPETHLRQGAPGEATIGLGAQHPRNMFAKKAYHGSPVPVVEYACTSPMAQSRIQLSGATNPAHLSAFATKPIAEQLTAKKLESIVGKPKFAPVASIRSQPTNQAMRQQRVIQQPGGRS